MNQQKHPISTYQQKQEELKRIISDYGLTATFEAMIAVIKEGRYLMKKENADLLTSALHNLTVMSRELK